MANDAVHTAGTDADAKRDQAEPTAARASREKRPQAEVNADSDLVRPPELEVVPAYDKLVPAHDKLVPAYDKLKPALPVMVPVPEMKSMHVPGRSPVVPRSGTANACDDEGIAQ